MQFCVRKFVAGLSDDISPPSHSPSRWLLSIKPTGTLICGVLIQKVISENVLVVPVLAPPVRHQAITWNYDDSFSIGPFGTNFNEIWFKIRKLSLKKMYSKMWSAMCLNSGRQWVTCPSGMYTEHNLGHHFICRCPRDFNTLRPKQNDRRFPDDIFKRIFLNENCSILTKVSLKFVAHGPIKNHHWFR